MAITDPEKPVKNVDLNFEVELAGIERAEFLPPMAEVIQTNGHTETDLNGDSSPTLSIETIQAEIADIFAPAPTPEVAVNNGAAAIAEPAPLVMPRTVTTAEKAKTPKFRIRSATEEDLDAIVDVDLRSFDSVYSEYDQDSETLRAELREKFEGRLEKLGGKWMPVLERDGEIVGFINGCPTSKTPEEFKSWEEMTDNGTLETTYDPDGENLYIVTLSVLDEGKPGKDMLYGDLIGKLLTGNFKQAFFESRLPGLRDWVIENKGGGSSDAIAALTPEEQEAFANEYFALTTEVRGKTVRQDKLLALYERIGCRPAEKVVPDAYQDEPSMNFGVVFTYDGKGLFDGSMLPKLPFEIPLKIPENRATRWMFGKLIQGVSHSQKLIKKLF